MKINNPTPPLFSTATNETANRAINNTVYQNTTPRPMQVTISAQIVNPVACNDIYFSGGPVSPPTAYQVQASNSITTGIMRVWVSLIIPAGHYYASSGPAFGLIKWIEVV